MRKIALILIAIALSGCGPSNEQLGAQVKESLQNQLDGPDFGEFHMKVEKVDVMHADGNKYEGIAAVEMDGQRHDVPVHIIADGSKMMYQTDNGAFMFAAQAKVKKALTDLASSMAPHDPTQDAPPPVQALINSETGLNEKCRGGSGDSPDTLAACADRDATTAQIKGMGWCWGHRNDIDADRKWVPCTASD